MLSPCILVYHSTTNRQSIKQQSSELNWKRHSDITLTKSKIFTKGKTNFSSAAALKVRPWLGLAIAVEQWFIICW